MDTYKEITQYNGDILLKKYTIDTMGYDIVNMNNGDILLRKIKGIDITLIDDIKKYDFTHSTINDCIVGNKKLDKLKYKSILKHVYDIINDGAQIIKHTKLNIKTIEKRDTGYYYLSSLGISVQGVDSNVSLMEIINQCIINE